MTSSNPFSTTDAQQDGDAKRDRYGRYLIPHPVTNKETPWTRATTFAKSISDTYVLSQWSQRMVAKGIAMRQDLRSLAAATPLTDRDKLNQIAEDAKTFAGAKESANLGTAMHAFTEAVDRGDNQFLASLSETEIADLKAYQVALAEAGIEVLPEYIEKTVVWTGYGIAGTFDRIVRMPNGELRIADLKTGRDLSYGWTEIAIQLGIYASASHIWDWASKSFSLMPEVSKTKAIVFHLPVGEAKCTIYELNIAEGIKAAELCHQVREWRKTRYLATPLSTSKTEETASVVNPATDLERVRAASSKGELSALWNQLYPAGRWTDELAAAAKDQMSKFLTA